MIETKIMINDCMDRESKMSDWETTFIDSIQNQIDEGRDLTQKQKNVVFNIWNKVTENG